LAVAAILWTDSVSLRTQDAGTGKITTAKQLSEVMQEHVPQDAEY